MKSETVRHRAFSLRRQGYSYAMISNKIGVSKSTLSDWLSRVRFVPNREVKERIGRAHIAIARAQQAKKLRSLELARSAARRDIGLIKKRDLLMLGLGVYIGEGSKTAGITRVTNSNPRIVKLILRWFKQVFGVPSSNFRVRVHVYPDTNTQTAVQYWSHQLSLPLHQFHKCYVDTRLGKSMLKKGKIPYGTAHVTVLGNGQARHGVFLQRRINAWIDKVLE